MLGNLAELGHRGIHLLDADGLLLRSGGDFLHQVGGLSRCRHDFIEQFAGPLRQAHAIARELADFLCRDLAAFGEFPHFRRDDGESLAMLTGASGFDGGIQRQQIGLIGDVVDDADLLGDLFHRRHGFRHRLTALCRLPGAVGGHVVGHLGVLRVLFDRGRHLLDRG